MTDAFLPQDALLDGRIECVVDARCELGESPLWDARLGRLWWVDIEGRAVHAYDEADGRHQRFALAKRPAALGLTDDADVLALAQEDGLYRWRWTDTAPPDLVAHVEEDLASTRGNDGKVGPDGHFWFGTMDERKPRQPVAGLYRVSPGGAVECVETGVIVSNGLAWSGDGRSMFHSDSTGPWIDRFDFDPATGRRGTRTRIATPTDEDGRPDGGACDAQGCYWSAGITAGCLNRYAPDGTVLAKFTVPVAAPTMPCFGGPDLKTLYFTSLRNGRSTADLERLPETGGLHRVRVNVAGVAPSYFRSEPG